jgi:hypothetical protein
MRDADRITKKQETEHRLQLGIQEAVFDFARRRADLSPTQQAQLITEVRAARRANAAIARKSSGEAAESAPAESPAESAAESAPAEPAADEEMAGTPTLIIRAHDQRVSGYVVTFKEVPRGYTLKDKLENLPPGSWKEIRPWMNAVLGRSRGVWASWSRDNGPTPQLKFESETGGLHFDAAGAGLGFVVTEIAPEKLPAKPEPEGEARGRAALAAAQEPNPDNEEEAVEEAMAAAARGLDDN